MRHLMLFARSVIPTSRGVNRRQVIGYEHYLGTPRSQPDAEHSAAFSRPGGNSEPPMTIAEQEPQRNIDALFQPRSIAIVGASENIERISGRLLYYLKRHGYDKPIYPVNPRRDKVQGLPCYPSLAEVPGPIDLVLVMLAAEHTVDVIRQAGSVGARAAIVYGSGFAETGREGEELQERLSATARQAGVRVLGPNCIGLINLMEGVAASFTRSLDLSPLRCGPVAYFGQSGAVGGSILNLTQERGLGLSVWASTGNQADLDILELAEEFINRSDILVFAVYLEDLPDGERYRRLARRVRQTGKHLVILRSGRSEAGQRAVASHTGAMLSPGLGFELVSEKEGVVLVDDVDELIDVAFALSANPLPEGGRVGIVTSSGGAGILAADHCELNGLSVPEMPAETRDRLTALVPAFGAVDNPVDVTAQLFNQMESGHPELFREVCLAVGETFDVLVVGLTMLTGDIARQIATDLVTVAETLRKPVLVAWLIGDELGAPAKNILTDAGLPVFSSTRAAVSAAARLVRRGAAEAEYTTPEGRKEPADITPWLARPTVLEGEGAALLGALGIPHPPGRLVNSPEEAESAAREMGEDLVLKIQSPDISHKTDVGGLRLGVTPENAPRVYEELVSHVSNEVPRAAIHGVLVQSMAPPGGHELILGVTRDPTFGYLLTLGFGGIGTEIYRDVASAVLPLSRAEAYELLKSLAGAPLLLGYRGRPPADVEALLDAICSVADSVEASGGRVQELEINPLFVYPEGRGILAADLVVRNTVASS
jgi:acetate---CoA ligase (ADP-forming)